MLTHYKHISCILLTFYSQSSDPTAMLGEAQLIMHFLRNVDYSELL